MIHTQYHFRPEREFKEFNLKAWKGENQEKKKRREELRKLKNIMRPILKREI